MKKIYSLGILLMMILCTSLSASATKITFEWETPGSVILKTSLSGDPVELAPDQTSYVAESTGNISAYFFAADGYALIDATLPDNTSKAPVQNWSDNKFYVGGTFTSYVIGNWGVEDPVVKINVKKIERTASLNIDVENGAEYLSASFTSSGLAVDLKNGESTLLFDPEIDKNLTINLLKGSPATTISSVTLNGEPVEIKGSSYGSISCTIPELAANDNLVIRVFEGEEPVIKDCALTLVYGEGMEGCLNNIRNATAGTFIMPDAIKDNTITVKEGTELWINLIGGDFTYSKFTLNDQDITSLFKNNQIKITLTEETNVLKIEGAGTVYADIDFTGYITNAEGVIFSLTYEGEAIEIGEGTAIDADMNILGNVMTTADTKKFIIPVSEKYGKVFFRPKDGYYISKVYINEEASYGVLGGSATINAESDGTTFYMFVEKLPEAYTASLNVIGTNRASMKGSAAIAGNWGNPEAQRYTVANGDFSFTPGFNTPLVIALSGDITSAVYLDGGAVKSVANADAGTNDYSFTPYYPTADTDAQLHSIVTVYADGTNGSTNLASASLTENDGVTAQFYYSPVRHEADKTNQQVLKGTELIVVPSTTDCYISYRGEIVHGYKADGTFVNGLNENGEYVLVAETNNRNNVIAVGKQNFFDININPANGATVKKIAEITVTVPFIEEFGEHMPYPDFEKLTGLTVSKGETVVASVAELGEFNQNEAGEYVFPLILSDAVAEAGEYTVTIPAGAFAESEWNDAVGDFAPVENGAVSKGVTATVTVDPTMKSPLEIYTISPASGSALRSLESVTITFPEYDAYTMFESLGFATISNGTTSYDCNISYNWEISDVRAFSIIPYDDDTYDDVIITEEGTWTLTIAAGSMTYEGESNPEITATFNISPENPAYPITPVPGSITGDLSNLTISFPGASEAEYNNIAISLEGEGFSTSTTNVEGEEYATEYQILFDRTPYTEGEYTVTIPAGAFTIDGNPSEEVVAKFTFKPIWKLTPAPGSTVESLNELTLEFPEATEVEFIGSSISFVLTNGSTYAAPGFDCTKVESAAHPTFLLTMPEGAQQPPLGSLTFRIDEGAFTIDGIENTGISVSYILDHAVSVEWTATPESTIVNEYGIFAAFIFDETTRVSIKNLAGITVNYAGEDLPAGSFEIMPESNMLLISLFDESLPQEGALKVSIEKGALSISGTECPAIEYTWTVLAPKTFSYAVTPAADTKVSDLSKITVAFTDAETAVVYNENGIQLVDDNYNYFYPEVKAVEDAEVPTFELTFANAPTTVGTYTLTIRRGVFILDNAFESPEIQAVYDFDPQSGINGITINGSTEVTVVTLDGRVILKDAPAASVKDLPAGLYIINGQKSLIK